MTGGRRFRAKKYRDVDRQRVRTNCNNRVKIRRVPITDRPEKRKQGESRWVMATHVNVKSVHRNHNKQTNRSNIKFLRRDGAVLGTPDKRPKRRHMSRIYVNIYCILPYPIYDDTRNKKEQLRFSFSNQNASFALHLPACTPTGRLFPPSTNARHFCYRFWRNKS